MKKAEAEETDELKDPEGPGTSGQKAPEVEQSVVTGMGKHNASTTEMEVSGGVS